MHVCIYFNQLFEDKNLWFTFRCWNNYTIYQINITKSIVWGKGGRGGEDGDLMGRGREGGGEGQVMVGIRLVSTSIQYTISNNSEQSHLGPVA